MNKLSYRNLQIELKKLRNENLIASTVKLNQKKVILQAIYEDFIMSHMDLIVKNAKKQIVEDEELSHKLNTDFKKIVKKIVFDLDIVFPPPSEFPYRVGCINKMYETYKDAKDEFQVDGANYVFSTFHIECQFVNKINIYNSKMTDERATKLLRFLPKNNSYLIRIKFLSQNSEGQWSVVDKYDPVCLEGKKGGNSVKISSGTKAGVLTGIDKVYYRGAYPHSVVVYGLYKINKPDIKKLRPMKQGDLNCVAQRVIEHYDGLLRGNGLTENRKSKIKEWEQEVHDSGASIESVSKLETILKRSIIIKDIIGQSIYDSGKYQKDGNRAHSHGKIELIMHNEHAWNAALQFPRTKNICFYEGDVWEQIYEITLNKPKAVWVIGGDDKKLNPDYVEQFVLADGSVYRTKDKHDSIIYECSNYVGEDMASTLANNVISSTSALFNITKEKNKWRATPNSLLEDIQKCCVEFRHGGLWCHEDGYDINDVVSLDMTACYPGSFKGMGDCAEYFRKYGHPTHNLVRVSVNGNLPDNHKMGFAQIDSWKFAKNVHNIIPAWFGSHFHQKGWAPIPLLKYMLDKGILKKLKITEAIISMSEQKNVWMPDDKDMCRRIIGKLTQGASNDRKRMTRRWVLDEAELDFLVNDLIKTNSLVGYDSILNGYGYVITYYDGYQPQYTHLRASMLGYVGINLINMLQRFDSEDVRRIATDSLYISSKTAKNKLHKVKAYNPNPKVSIWANWIIKKETILSPNDDAKYTSSPEFWNQKKHLTKSTEPSIEDSLSTKQLCYLNGGGGCGKTTRAIELFRKKQPIVLTPTHRLAKEMKDRGVRSQTYHSFFRWDGQKKWTPDRMGNKYIPKVIIWDEICTVPKNTLETFLEWLVSRDVQVICCGDHGQPPPIVGDMPHDWLKNYVDYYEEVSTDHRAKDDKLKVFKQKIRLASDTVQCEEMRKALPNCISWENFLERWKPDDIILSSRQKVRDKVQEILLERHKTCFPNDPVPLLYHPKDSRKQNISVNIPGTTDKQVMVLNDIVYVPFDAVEKAIKTCNWRLGYSITVHSSQGLTIKSPMKVWIIDDYLRWSNLIYLAVSRVEYMSQLERVKAPTINVEENKINRYNLRHHIQKKLVSYKKQDNAKGRRYDLKVDDVLDLKEMQENKCAICTINMLWSYTPQDLQQYSVDRIDNSKGHVKENIQLCCLECNKKRGGN